MMMMIQEKEQQQGEVLFCAEPVSGEAARPPSLPGASRERKVAEHMFPSCLAVAG